MPSQSSSLYKYIKSKRLTDFLKQPTLRFTPPRELNDLFEMSPNVTNIVHIDRTQFAKALGSNKCIGNDIEGKQIFIKAFRDQNPSLVTEQQLFDIIIRTEQEYANDILRRSIDFIEYLFQYFENYNSDDPSAIELRKSCW